MTHMPHRTPHATNFLAATATSSSLRSERVRQSTASIATKRVVHTSLIDAGWDLSPETPATGQLGAQQIHALAPRTSLIDAEWNQQPDAGAAHRSGPHRIDALAPRTSLIDAQWDPPLMDGFKDQSEPAELSVRPRQLALVDAEEEEDLDPVITYFELDGPECLGLLASELD